MRHSVHPSGVIYLLAGLFLLVAHWHTKNRPSKWLVDQISEVPEPFPQVRMGRGARRLSGALRYRGLADRRAIVEWLTL